MMAVLGTAATSARAADGTVHGTAAHKAVSIDIPAQPLAEALTALGKQTGLQVVLYASSARQTTARLMGVFTPQAALEQLLANTGLRYEYLDPKTVAILAETTARPSAQTTRDADADPQQAFSLKLAQSQNTARVTENTAERDRAAQKSENTAEALEEVIVTAQKRAEHLLDVPQSVTVLAADELAKSGALQFRDFATHIPGVAFSSRGAGFAQISLRGVGSLYNLSPTTAIYVDETPYGSSSPLGSGYFLALDVGLFDLDRVEVLKGPQGTLYGATSLGGLIKYVSKRPDSSGLRSSARVGVSSTHDGGVSYNGAAAVNMPFGANKGALRLSGFHSHDGGYIDNVTLGADDVNRANISGGRADLLLTPTDALSIRLTGFAQDIDRQGEDVADYAFSGAPLGNGLIQHRLLREPFEQRFRLGSATIDYDFGWASLASITSYQTTRSDFSFDASGFYLGFIESVFGSTYAAVADVRRSDVDKFTQELRLSSGSSGRLEWLVGGFYNRESAEEGGRVDPRGLLAGSPAPLVSSYVSPSAFDEHAAFGDLTWHFTDRVDVTGGLRYAHNKLSVEQLASGIFVGSLPQATSSESVVTRLANARYRFSEHTNLYVRYATGYRPGGPNYVLLDLATGQPAPIPRSFEADKLTSYELGFKAESPDRRFALDAAVFDNDWDNIIIIAFENGFSFRGNAPGGAKMRGAELTLSAKPVSHVTLTGAFAYTDAYYSAADANVGVQRGERLPFVPRFTAVVGGEYHLPQSRLQPMVGATVRYVSDRTATLSGDAVLPQYPLPAYTAVDLRAGLEIGSVDLQLYARNIFDKRGQLSALTYNGFPQPTLMQPRTFGMTATMEF